jgi:hypothetical protein
VDTLDFNNLAANFGQQLAEGSAAQAVGSLVPEPSSLAAVGLLVASLSIRTRRRPARGT